MSTAVSFPYGQLGAAMPIAVALALFANINMSFGRAGPAVSKGKGVLEGVTGCKVLECAHQHACTCATQHVVMVLHRCVCVLSGDAFWRGV